MDKDDAVFDHFTCRLITVFMDMDNTEFDNFTGVVACTDAYDSVFYFTVLWHEQTKWMQCLVVLPAL